MPGILKLGGETPIIKYGTELTLQTPDGISEAAPQAQGDIFKIGGPASDGTQLKAVPAVAGDTMDTDYLVMALTRETVPGKPAGYKLLSGGMVQIRRLGYVSGAAPTLGQSVAVSATNVRKVAGIAQAHGCGLVVAVNTGDLEVEVLC
jgi:hypothetical protein